MKIRRLCIYALLSLGILALSGCASILSESVYPVSISSDPTGAKITIVNAEGVTIHSSTTPTLVSLPANSAFFSGQTYTIKASKDGETAQTTLIARVDGWYFANILFGGVIGMLIVDPATGAMWQLDTTRHLNLNTNDDGEGADESALRIVDIEELPEEARTALIPVR